MRATITFLFIFLFSVNSNAQTMGINYKAVIKDDLGAVVANQAIDVRFNIIDNLNVVYSETHTVTTDANGIIILTIGEGAVVSGSYTLLDWPTKIYGLKTEIDIEQDGDYTNLGTTIFKAVPYALHAKTATTAITALNAGATSIDGLSDGKTSSTGSSLFLGENAGANNIANNGNVGIGSNALNQNTSGSSNTAIGRNALLANTTGFSNTAIGRSALLNNTTGNSNTANGMNTLESNTTGVANTAIGRLALTSNVSGSFNTGTGFSALYVNTTGVANTANGSSALYFNTIGNDNTAIGSSALLSNVSGNSNTANGKSALSKNTTGTANTANGSESLLFNTIGNDNTANGTSALYSNDSGNRNTANGRSALSNNTKGSGNVALGYRAGFFETGSNALYIANTDTAAPLIYGEFDNDILGFNGDVAIGHQEPLAPIHIKKEGNANVQTVVAVLESATSDRPTLLFSESSNSTLNAGMSIEYNGIDSGNENKLVFNATNNDPLIEIKNSGNLIVKRAASRVGLGISSPTRQLQLSLNSAAKPGSATWEITSDRRLKKDIKPFSDGMETLKQIDPVWFTYNGKAGMPIETNVGTIAQDLEKAAPYLIKDWKYTDDNGATENYLSVDYGPLTFILVNAIKEQAAEIETLKKTYDNKIKNLEARLLKLEN